MRDKYTFGPPTQKPRSRAIELRMQPCLQYRRLRTKNSTKVSNNQFDRRTYIICTKTGEVKLPSYGLLNETSELRILERNF